jgi:hypothetical protein
MNGETAGATTRLDMQWLSAAIDPGGKRIIQILSALIADFSVDDFVLVKSDQ